MFTSGFFSVLHALSIVAISLGMAEQDGLAVMLGIVAGIVSLAILASAGVSGREVRAKVMQSLQKMARQRGINALQGFLERLGFPMLAKLLKFKWSDLILMWDPERGR
jgi:Exopolysaccharide synthesis, ExoD